MVLASVGVASSPDESSPSWFACVGEGRQEEVVPALSPRCVGCSLGLWRQGRQYCKGITPYMTVCSLATLTTKHSIICLYMVLYYDERRTTKLRT